MEGIIHVDTWIYGFEYPFREEQHLERFEQVMSHSWTKPHIKDAKGRSIEFLRNFPMNEYNLYHNSWKMYLSVTELSHIRRFEERRRKAEKEQVELTTREVEEGISEQGRDSDKGSAEEEEDPDKGILNNSFMTEKSNTSQSSVTNVHTSVDKIRLLTTPLDLKKIEEHAQWKRLDITNKFSLEQVTVNVTSLVNDMFIAYDLVEEESKARDTWFKWTFDKFYFELRGCLTNNKSIKPSDALQQIKHELDHQDCVLDVKDFRDMMVIQNLQVNVLRQLRKYSIVTADDVATSACSATDMGELLFHIYDNIVIERTNDKGYDRNKTPKKIWKESFMKSFKDKDSNDTVVDDRAFKVLLQEITISKFFSQMHKAFSVRAAIQSSYDLAQASYVDDNTQSHNRSNKQDMSAIEIEGEVIINLESQRLCQLKLNIAEARRRIHVRDVA